MSCGVAPQKSGFPFCRIGTICILELDINVVYDYTEDVTFGLGLAWFFPGDIYDNASAGGTNLGPLDDSATSVTTNVSVVF